MSKHTPGPWEFRPLHDSTGLTGKVWGKNWPIGELYGDITDPDQAKADARMIAAAPEMLEALQKIADWHRDDAQYCESDRIVYDIASDAIAKATGEA